jgi:hypothetical protein
MGLGHLPSIRQLPNWRPFVASTVGTCRFVSTIYFLSCACMARESRLKQSCFPERCVALAGRSCPETASALRFCVQTVWRIGAVKSESTAHLRE